MFSVLAFKAKKCHRAHECPLSVEEGDCKVRGERLLLKRGSAGVSQFMLPEAALWRPEV